MPLFSFLKLLRKSSEKSSMKALLIVLLLMVAAHAEDNKSFTQIREDRIAFFVENGSEKMKDFDDLELDLLYQDLAKLSILELYQKYPEFTPKELEELKTKRK